MLIEKHCDIIVLAEYSFDMDELLAEINANSKYSFSAIPNFGGCERIRGIIKNSYRIKIIQEQNRYKIIKLETTYYKLIMAMIHNVDRRNSDENERKEMLRIFNNDIREAETSHKTKNTIVLGDFNANPFEESLIASNAMHAIPYKDEVLTGHRTVNGVSYEKFYNPMWKLLAKEEAPYATFRYNNSKLTNYYWYMFDQIIIRPALISALDESTLTILTNCALVKDGKPNKAEYSDHLPIFCTIKEENLK